MRWANKQPMTDSSKSNIEPVEIIADENVPNFRRPLLTPEQMGKIIDALNVKEAKMDCARCGFENLTLAPGLAYLPLYEPNSPAKLGGTVIPAAVAVCQRCGAVSHHALGMLGFMDSDGRVSGL